MSLTRAQLLAEVARVRLEAAALLAYADDLERLARNAPLTTGAKRSIVGSKVEANVTGKSRFVRQAASRTRRDSEAKRTLLEAGYTDQDVADALKVGRSTVNAWFSGARSIPAVHVKTLAAAPFKVPASAWPRVA